MTRDAAPVFPSPCCGVTSEPAPWARAYLDLPEGEPRKCDRCFKVFVVKAAKS